MPYRIRLGIPAFKAFYDDLAARAVTQNLDKDEIRQFKLVTRAIGFLSANPRHNSLNSHEIVPLSQRYSKSLGMKIKV